MKPWVVLIILSSFSICIYGSVFYVDPQNGDPGNDGSISSPWRTLKEVFDSSLIESKRYESKPYSEGAPMVVKNSGAPVKAGDTLMLRTGYHDTLNASEYYNDDYITIMAQPGHTPRLGFVRLRSGCKWRLQGLHISPEFMPSPKVTTLINFENHGWSGASFDCIAIACTAYTVNDASTWSLNDWDTKSCNAMSLPGKKMVASGNYFKNVNFGISVSGDSCLVEYNTVENFAGDGLRGLGDYDIFQYNVVKNCYDVNANHDDGFQSWSVGDNGVGTGVVKGMILRGNTIINYEDPNQPFRGTLQGIGCFDGMFEDWRVENNVVITDHWHGITLSGSKNCVIINNTVVDVNTQTPGPPWVRIGDHKNGTQSTGCVVRNNLTTSLNCDGGVVVDHNIDLYPADYDTYFNDYGNGDLTLKSGCPAIDSGSSDLAPNIDIIGTWRPVNSRVDVGAYEYYEGDMVDDNPAMDDGEDIIRCYPNPFNPKIKIAISSQLTAISEAELNIYNVNGKMVKRLTTDSRQLTTGITLDATKLPQGIYFLRVKINNKQYFKKLFLVR